MRCARLGVNYTLAVRQETAEFKRQNTNYIKLLNSILLDFTDPIRFSEILKIASSWKLLCKLRATCSCRGRMGSISRSTDSISNQRNGRSFRMKR